jgi:hypothetical protein
LGEHQLDKLGVTGSSPVPPISKRRANAGFFALKSGTGDAAEHPVAREWRVRVRVRAGTASTAEVTKVDAEAIERVGVWLS